jgi:hypothetical protein
MFLQGKSLGFYIPIFWETIMPKIIKIRRWLKIYMGCWSSSSVSCAKIQYNNNACLIFPSVRAGGSEP